MTWCVDVSHNRKFMIDEFILNKIMHNKISFLNIMNGAPRLRMSTGPRRYHHEHVTPYETYAEPPRHPGIKYDNPADWKVKDGPPLSLDEYFRLIKEDPTAIDKLFNI